MKRYLAELVGTFFLALAINITGDPLAIGLMFMCMLYLCGPVSGAHLNPIVSLAMWLRGLLATAELPGYWIAQILGGCLVSVFTFVVGGKILPAKTLPAQGFGVLFAFELLFSFVLVSMILLMFTSKRYAGNALSALVVGLTLTALVYYAGSYNPAVSLGWMLPNAITHLATGGAQGAMPGLYELLVFLVAPFLGAIAAVYKYKCMHSDSSANHTANNY
jgi:aquaporin Z